MKRLYRVLIEAEAYVVASSLDEAEFLVGSHISGEAMEGVGCFANAVKSTDTLPQVWRGGSIPFGDADDRTAEDWLAETIEAQKAAAEVEAHPKLHPLTTEYTT